MRLDVVATVLSTAQVERAIDYFASLHPEKSFFYLVFRDESTTPHKYFVQLSRDENDIAYIGGLNIDKDISASQNVEAVENFFIETLLPRSKEPESE